MRACSPTTLSSRMAGNGPNRLHVWKNGPQSI
ncbi:Uncharacterised protein [Bordetella pertussis]|nr:Uncharacterised protein [Bordetella pertussis]